MIIRRKLALAVTVAFLAGPQLLIGTEVEVTVQPQPWQLRRQDAQKVISAWQAKPVSASTQKEMDALLAEYEKNPLARTPLECLDLIGQYYVPKDSPDACIPIIAMDTVLGWYDALRFASQSGRSELIDNEHFFARAYLLAGPQSLSKFKDLITSDPKRVSELVNQGIAQADKARAAATYDEHWPTAYGLERMITALGGK